MFLVEDKTPKNYVMTIGCDFNVKMVALEPEHTNGLNVGVEPLLRHGRPVVFNQRQHKSTGRMSTVMA